MPRGRKPTPLNLRVVQGNPGKRKIPDDIPKPKATVKVPRAPKQLSVAARPYWRQFARELSNMRVLTSADYPALAMLSEQYAIYWEAMDGVRQYGIIGVTPNNHLVRSEWLNTANKAMDQCLKILLEFGLTPSARMRVREE